MSRWPRRLDRGSVKVEPPAWFRVFVPADWIRLGDEEARYAGGALMGVEEVARRRWRDAQRAWAKENSFDVVSYLQERTAARRRNMREGPGRR
jgi:hypothetical protein